MLHKEKMPPSWGQVIMLAVYFGQTDPQGTCGHISLSGGCRGATPFPNFCCDCVEKPFQINKTFAFMLLANWRLEVRGNRIYSLNVTSVYQTLTL